jgi:hypothetical protein
VNIESRSSSEPSIRSISGRRKKLSGSSGSVIAMASWPAAEKPSTSNRASASAA